MILYERIPGTQNFRWIEALTLREWGWCAYPGDDQEQNIIHLAKKLQLIRDLLNRRIYIRSWLRPEQYNSFVNGATLSAHVTGEAVDFQVEGYQNIGGADCVRAIVEPKLEEFGLRMENLPGSDWIHVDTKEPKINRYFIP